MTVVANLLLWTGIGMTLYLYLGYPLLLWLLTRVVRRPIQRGSATPRVTVIVVAHDEERWIGAKVRSTLALDYPGDRLEVLVASDGSTDRTEQIVAACDDERVRLLRLPRRGKAFALNDAAAAATGEILVFTDANSRIRRDALRKIVRNFADREVGGVCGAKLTLPAGGDTTELGEGLYWRFDQWQKTLETRLGNVFAADGTLYAIRHDLYVPLRDAAVADDIAISARVVLQGKRLVFEPEAIAEEPAPERGDHELSRKIRVTNHSLRALLGLRSGLWSRGLYSFELLSHKLLRHLSPFFLVAAAVGAVLLAPTSAVARTALAALAALGLLGGLGALGREHGWGRHPVFAFPYYFLLVNSAALLGTLSVLAGVKRATWNPRGGLQR